MSKNYTKSLNIMKSLIALSLVAGMWTYPAAANADSQITATSPSVSQVVSPINSLPNPMTYAEAALYQKKYTEDITLHLYTQKDSNGNKNKLRIFDFLKNDGLSHSGNTLAGVADRTVLRMTVNYGF